MLGSALECFRVSNERPSVPICSQATERTSRATRSTFLPGHERSTGFDGHERSNVVPAPRISIGQGVVDDESPSQMETTVDVDARKKSGAISTVRSERKKSRQTRASAASGMMSHGHGRPHCADSISILGTKMYCSL